MLLRIETNIKLNPIDKSGQGMIKDKEEDEVHFVRFEANVGSYELKIGTLWKMIKERNKKELDF